MSEAQRRIISERAFFQNTGTGSGDQMGRPIPWWTLHMFSWVNSEEGWPLWTEWADACRVVARARGHALRGLANESLPRTVGRV